MSTVYTSAILFVVRYCRNAVRYKFCAHARENVGWIGTDKVVAYTKGLGRQQTKQTRVRHLGRILYHKNDQSHQPRTIPCAFRVFVVSSVATPYTVSFLPVCLRALWTIPGKTQLASFGGGKEGMSLLVSNPRVTAPRGLAKWLVRDWHSEQQVSLPRTRWSLQPQGIIFQRTASWSCNPWPANYQAHSVLHWLVICV